MLSDDDCHFETTLSSIFKSIEPRNVVQFIEYDCLPFNQIDQILQSKYHWIYFTNVLLMILKYLVQEIERDSYCGQYN
jgi:hypothetical protein